MPASPQGAERRVAGHPGEETSSDRPNSSLVSFPGMVFSRLCHLAGALVSLWRHMLSACVFAVYVLRVSVWTGGGERGCQRAGASKSGGEQRVFPSQQPGAPARAPKLVLWPFSGRAKSKAPRQSHPHVFAKAPNFGCGSTNCRVARRSGAEPSLRRGRVFPGSGRRARGSGRALGGKPDTCPWSPSFGEDLPAVSKGVDRNCVPPGRCFVSSLSAAGFQNGGFLA